MQVHPIFDKGIIFTMMSPSAPQRQAFWLLKDINKAIRDFEMIEDGDKIAVALSGGKDSMSLLRLLDWRRASSPEKYGLTAIHVIGDADGPKAATHQPLLDWLETRDYEYAVERMYLPDDEQLPLNCRRCTWNRRRTIFETTQRLGCNVIAMGHHADDLAQTTLLNLLYHGKVETMAPVGDYFEGTFRLIRPLAYTSESAIRRFAKTNNFPPPPPDCPHSDHTSRKLMAKLIQQAEKNCQDIRVNLLRAGLKGTYPDKN